MQLETTIYTDLTVFTQLKDEWLDLLGRSVTNYVFQTPQFQGAWWQALGYGTLQVIAVRTKAGELVGLAPLFMDDNNQLCFVGCINVSDYLDVLVDRNYQQEVYEAFTSTLKQTLKDWQSMYLCSLPEETHTRQWLKDTFEHAEEKQQDISPFIPLPPTWEEYLANINRKQRHEIKRKMRRVSEVDHEYELITSEEQTKQAMPEFISLHKASSAEKRDFWDNKHFRFFSQFVPDAAEAGWVKLYFLKIEQKRAAAMLVLDYNNQFQLYNSGFDPEHFKSLSPGNVLTAYTIQQAIEQQKSIYDFLRGDEEYKFRFGAKPQPVFDIGVSQR